MSRPLNAERKQARRLNAMLLLLVVSVSGIYFEKRQQQAEVSAIVPGHLPTRWSGWSPVPTPAVGSEPVRTPGLPKSDPAVLQIIKRLLDESLPLKARRRAARSLAELGSDKALAASSVALENGSPFLKAAIGEGLGLSRHPDASSLLSRLADGADEMAARGAIRGLGLRGDAEATELLGKILFDSQKTESVRTEAALALGDVRRPDAQAFLVRGANEFQDGSLTENVLEGLGKRPFAETVEFFHSYLESPAWSIESKVVALEAIRQADGDVAPFLLKYAGHHDPKMRAAAAWALSSLDAPAELGPQLIALLQREPSQDVRVRLYQALRNQNNCDWSSVLKLVKSESEPGPRLAGFTLLAQNWNAEEAPEVRDFFNQTVLPETQAIALNSPNPEDRLAAAMTLMLAGSDQSGAALQEIVRLSHDSKVVAAVRAALGDPLRADSAEKP